MAQKVGVIPVPRSDPATARPEITAKFERCRGLVMEFLRGEHAAPIPDGACPLAQRVGHAMMDTIAGWSWGHARITMTCRHQTHTHWQVRAVVRTDRDGSLDHAHPSIPRFPDHTAGAPEAVDHACGHPVGRNSSKGHRGDRMTTAAGNATWTVASSGCLVPSPWPGQGRRPRSTTGFPRGWDSRQTTGWPWDCARNCKGKTGLQWPGETRSSGMQHGRVERHAAKAVTLQEVEKCSPDP